MKSCDLISGVGRMKRSTSLLKEKWLQTQAHWKDRASQDFQKNFLQDLGPQITLVVAAVQEFAELLEKAEKDLIDPDRNG